MLVVGASFAELDVGVDEIGGQPLPVGLGRGANAGDRVSERIGGEEEVADGSTDAAADANGFDAGDEPACGRVIVAGIAGANEGGLNTGLLNLGRSVRRAGRGRAEHARPVVPGEPPAVSGRIAEGEDRDGGG